MRVLGAGAEPLTLIGVAEPHSGFPQGRPSQRGVPRR